MKKRPEKLLILGPFFFHYCPEPKIGNSYVSEIRLIHPLLYQHSTLWYVHTHFTKLLLMYCTWNVHTTNPYITQRIQQWKAHSKLIAVFFAQPTAIFLIATCSFWLVVGTHSTRPKRFAQRWVFKVSIRS